MLHTLDRNLVFNVSNYQILVYKIHFCLIEGSLTNYVDKLACNQIRKPIVNNVHNELNILKYKQTTSDRPGPQPRPKFISSVKFVSLLRQQRILTYKFKYIRLVTCIYIIYYTYLYIHQTGIYLKTRQSHVTHFG